MPMTDEELAEIKQAAKEAKAEAKRAREENAQLSAKHDNLQGSYQSDMRIVGDRLFNQPAPAAAQQQAAPEEEGGELTIDRIRQEIANGVARGVQMPAAQISHSLMTHSRELARTSIPEFDRYAPEIDDLVKRAVQANPQAFTNPSLYKDAYDVVRLQHQDEIIAEQVKKRLRDAGVEDEEDEEVAAAASDAETPSTPAPREREFGDRPEGRRSPFAEPVVASGSASSRTPIAARRSRARYASEDEAYMAEQFGLSGPEEVAKYSNAKYSEDVLGLRDPKTGRVRDRV